MNMKQSIKAAALAFAAGAAPIASVAASVQLDAVEIASDTNIVVETGDTLKIEYVYGDNPVTVTKSGGGRLEIATSSISNLSVVVADGTFASARPQALQLNEDFNPTLRIDANDTSKFTTSQSNGTNFISKITDADGGSRWLASWGGTYNKPFVATEKLNGLGLIDFGAFLDRNVAALSGGHGGNLGVNKIDGKDGFPLREYFYVWKDRDDLYDPRLADEPDYYGASVLGNNGNYFLRCKGNATQGFGLITGGSYNTFKMNLILDGKKVSNTYCPSRGFHVLRNRAYDTNIPYLTMIGWNYPRGGGFYLAELIACSNLLSEATAKRVEAQLQSKWLGLKLKNIAVREGATLDVGAFPFKIGTLDLQNEVQIAGATNLCFDALTRCSSNVVATGEVKIYGDRLPLVPDLVFEGDAVLDVSGTARVQTVSATSGNLAKTGGGELLVADPAVENITVSEGTLSVSPLYVRSAEYHLDSTRADTIEWAETDGKKLVSAWHDIEDPSRVFKACEYRKPGYDQTRLIRPPYVTENAVGDKTMVDFGTFGNVNHPDGWGGCLDASPSFGVANGLHDYFAVWKDDPAVKNYAVGGDGKEFIGPCIFGMQYHWSRGNGGGGNAFPIHAEGCPAAMWSPINTGLVYVDGTEVHGQKDRIGDGVHVLAQRTHSNDGYPGAPIEQLGGSYQANAYNSEGVRVNGTFGGLMIGEVLMFKEYLTDRLRMRISGALCSKWRGDTNEWAYGSVAVAAGATLNHPYADLAVENLELGGTISAVRVMPSVLVIPGSGGAVDGTLELRNGGQVVIEAGPGGNFSSARASRVKVSGSGSIVFRGDVSAALCGQSFRIVEAESVDAPGMSWKAQSLRGTGLRAVLSGKEDGLYLTFSSGGFVVSFK